MISVLLMSGGSGNGTTGVPLSFGFESFCHGPGQAGNGESKWFSLIVTFGRVDPTST